MKTYPQAPGFKGEAETSQQAARSVETKADQMRRGVVKCLQKEDLTHDECAARMRPCGMTDVEFEGFKRSVRSRGSELKAAGKIADTGKRRKNTSGRSAVVWRLIKEPAATVYINSQTKTATTAKQLDLL
jgi:hypothetical protein